MTRGIFLTAFGKPGYIYSAFNFATSIKHHNPDLQIALFHDSTLELLQPWQRNVFDITIEIPKEIKNRGGVFNPGRVKTSVYEFLPFDINLVLDVDALAFKDIEPIFDELEQAGGYYYSNILGTHTINKGNDIPHLMWAYAEDIWEKYGLDEKTVFPCVNSSFQYIVKGEQAKALFDQINKNFDDPIPLHKLKTQWGANQPDELYLDIALAQLGIDPTTPRRYLFFANSNTDFTPVEQLREKYEILSIFGSKEMIKVRFREFYDQELIEIFRKQGVNHQYKLVYILNDKHANTKPIKQATVANSIFQTQATLKTALTPISDTIEIDHTKLIQNYLSPTGRNIQVTNWFNCSFIEFKGKTYFVYRLEAKPFCVNIRIGICLLDDNYQPIADSNVLLNLHAELHAPHGRTYAKGYHVEDPRLFIYNDDLYLSYTDGYQMAQARINPKTLQAEESFYIKKPDPQRTEKNWVFFEHDKRLLAVYDSSPHTIFEMNGADWKKVYEQEWRPEWKYGTIRGGTPPIKIGDRYLSFFHSAIGVKHRGMEGRQYFMGAYTFEAKPPFRPLSVTRNPIIAGEWVEDGIPRLSNAIFVVFPSGAIRKEKGWLVSFGYNDYRCRFIEITDQELESNMIELTPKLQEA